MDFILMGYEITAWQAFAALGFLFIILEVFAPGFVLLPIGIACLLTIPEAILIDDWLAQLGFFGVNLITVFAIVIKVIRPKLKNKQFKTNIDSMVGQTVEVIEDIGPSKHGYVKLYGDQWQAHSDLEIATGSKAKILKIDGNKVIVGKLN